MIQPKTPRRGILLMNLGSPDSTEVRDVKRYLDEFLMDKRVIDYPYLLRLLLIKGIITPRRALWKGRRRRNLSTGGYLP